MPGTEASFQKILFSGGFLSSTNYATMTPEHTWHHSFLLKCRVAGFINTFCSLSKYEFFMGGKEENFSERLSYYAAIKI